MLNDSGWMQVLSKVLRPAFGLALFLSQFTATRDTLFTESGALLLFFAWAWFGVLLVFAPLWVIECQAEEREMERIHGPAYRTYQQRTGMFFPKVQLK